MADVFQYYGRFQNVRGQFAGLPPWARSVVTLFALPGILLAVLSLILFLVSILALFLLTAPVYRLLQGITGGNGPLTAGSGEIESPTAGGFGFGSGGSPGRKSVQVRVVE